MDRGTSACQLRGWLMRILCFFVSCSWKVGRSARTYARQYKLSSSLFILFPSNLKLSIFPLQPESPSNCTNLALIQHQILFSTSRYISIVKHPFVLRFNLSISPRPFLCYPSHVTRDARQSGAAQRDAIMVTARLSRVQRVHPPLSEGGACPGNGYAL